MRGGRGDTWLVKMPSAAGVVAAIVGLSAGCAGNWHDVLRSCASWEVKVGAEAQARALRDGASAASLTPATEAWAAKIRVADFFLDADGQRVTRPNGCT